MTERAEWRQLEPFDVAGVRVRTCNADEFSPLRARLPALWQRFGRPAPAVVYGVYSAYSAGVDGDYDVTVGVAGAPTLPEQQAIRVVGGSYLVFRARGQMPAAVLAAWQQVWTHFAANRQLQRRFATDFECYDGVDSVAVYIGVLDG